ncbi:hypothetical protein BHE74_00018662, partial [Ensete ventricosum]
MKSLCACRLAYRTSNSDRRLRLFVFLNASFVVSGSQREGDVPNVASSYSLSSLKEQQSTGKCMSMSPRVSSAKAFTYDCESGSQTRYFGNKGTVQVHLPSSFSIKGASLLCREEGTSEAHRSWRLKALRYGSGRDGRGATSFLLLRGGAELPSDSQGTVHDGGRSVAAHQLREAADTGDDAGYDSGGGQLLGFGRELSAFGCISSVRGGCTRLDGSRDGSLLEQHHHDRVVFSASSDCGAMRRHLPTCKRTPCLPYARHGERHDGTVRGAAA